MRTVTLLLPRKLVFGQDCVCDCAHDVLAAGFKHPLIITSPPTVPLTSKLVDLLTLSGARTTTYDKIDKEPTIEMFEEALKFAHFEKPDVIIGLGGGSALDAAKLIAAFIYNKQNVRETFGINLLAPRPMYLVCLPTTSGTGSEVSPNAILLDEEEKLKKGVVSPFLMPDATYVDPLLTVTMPPLVTASTGMDALTHCIEAYTNKFAHPMIDVYAIEGIQLAGRYLARAVKNGNDMEARESMSLASVCGGTVLGPVGTAAVHALSYPLGGEFHIAHGISTAVLLPHVMEFNISAAAERYARVAIALGAKDTENPVETALLGVECVKQLMKQCGMPMSLSELKIPQSAILHMAEAGMKVTRLLKNNPRELTPADACRIYENAFGLVATEAL